MSGFAVETVDLHLAQGWLTLGSACISSRNALSVLATRCQARRGSALWRSFDHQAVSPVCSAAYVLASHLLSVIDATTNEHAPTSQNIWRDWLCFVPCCCDAIILAESPACWQACQSVRDKGCLLPLCDPVTIDSICIPT